MTCRELAEMLSDYLDGELEPAVAEHVTRHLSVCPPCEVFVSTYRLTVQISRRLPSPPLPPQVASRLEEVLRREGQQGNA